MIAGQLTPPQRRLLVAILVRAQAGKPSTLHGLGSDVGRRNFRGLRRQLLRLREAGLVTWDNEVGRGRVPGQVGGTIRPTCRVEIYREAKS